MLEKIAKLLEELTAELKNNTAAHTGGTASGVVEQENDDLGLGDAPEEKEEEKPLTIDDVQNAIRAAAGKAQVNKDKVKAVLKKFGVERGTDLKAEKYAEFIAAVGKVK